MDLEELVDPFFRLAGRVPIGLLAEVVFVVLRRESQSATTAFQPRLPRKAAKRSKTGKPRRLTKPYMNPFVKNVFSQGISTTQGIPRSSQPAGTTPFLL